MLSMQITSLALQWGSEKWEGARGLSPWGEWHFCEGGSAPSCGSPEHELELKEESEFTPVLARGILNWAEVCSEVCISDPTAVAAKRGGMSRAKKRNPFAWLKIVGNWKARVKPNLSANKNSNNDKKQQQKSFP